MPVAALTKTGDDLSSFLIAQGLADEGEVAHWEPLAGGVSSDIWRVDLPGRSFCVKRALARLKTDAEWTAPVSRNAYEWAWMQFAAQHSPDNVPRPLAHDGGTGLFAMSFFPPDTYPVWKQQLMSGHVNEDIAREIGRVVGLLHAKSANRTDLAAAFDTTENFYSLRLEPYLIASAARNPTVAPQLTELSARTANIRLALVHGDISPKNVLVGPHGPVLLDAECAWYGDPAFDLAFCLNHLLLKCFAIPERSTALLNAFEALAGAYLDQVDWEPCLDIEQRAAHLLPALLLARIDGKSPVEYLTDQGHRDRIRKTAIQLLRQPSQRLSRIAFECWCSAMLK